MKISHLHWAAVIPGFILLGACTATPPSPGPVTVSSEVLLESAQSWDGQGFAYPEGDAQLTLARISMPAGSALPMHCHPVPLGGFLAKGRLEVFKEDGQTLVLEEGQPLIEVSMQWHYGRAIEDSEILVVYSGAEGVPVTVFKDGESEWVRQCY